MAFRPFVSVTLLLWFGLIATIDLVAQDANTAESKSDPNLVDPPDPVIEQLQAQASASNDALVSDAITKLVRLGQWELVDQTLTRISKADRDEAKSVQMARTIGPTLMVRMLASEELSEGAKAFVKTLSDQYSKFTTSSERLRAAINDLAAADASGNQTDAIRTLMSGGRASIIELVHAIATTNDSTGRERLVRMLLKLGDDGPMALEQLSVYGDTTVRTGALAALATIDPSRFASNFVSGFHAVDASDAEKQVAQTGLRRFGSSVPDFGLAVRFLSHELDRAQHRAAVSAGDQEVVPLWNVTPDAKSVSVVDTTVAHAMKRAAAVAAARLQRIGELLPEPEVLSSLRADLGYRIVIDPLWGSPAQVESVMQLYGGRVNDSLLETVIDESISRHDWAALLGCIRCVQQTADSAGSWLVASSGQPSPLLRALSCPIPRVRYEAAIAIGKLEPSDAFAGSTTWRATLAEMSRLTSDPLALIVETTPELVVRQEMILKSMGLAVESLRSVSELEDRVARGGDIRLILSQAALNDARPISMVDRVRRLASGAEIPILFYGEEENVLGSESWDVPTLQIPQPRSAATIGALFQSWYQPAALPPLVASERTYYRSLATDFFKSK